MSNEERVSLQKSSAAAGVAIWGVGIWNVGVAVGALLGALW